MTIALKVRYHEQPSGDTAILTIPLCYSDIAAAQHHLDVAIGWFADPVYLGHYPLYMREMLGERLPDFTGKEWALVKGSSDF